MKHINKLKNSKVWLGMVILYMSFMNIFVLKTTPELIVLQFALIILISKKMYFNKFMKDWLPYVGLFFLYEFLRGFADNLSPFYNITLYWIYNIEASIFKTLPTTTLQDLFLENPLVLNLSLLFYTSFFYYSFLVAFILWYKNGELFTRYRNRFLLLSFASLLVFFLIPTAPPWFVAKIQEIAIRRPVYQETILKNFIGLSFWSYFVYGNPVAALPSLHTAWPAFTSLFLIKEFKEKKYYLTLIIPLMIGFSVVLTGEHFLIDIVAGWIFAVLALNINLTKIKNRVLKTTRSPG